MIYGTEFKKLYKSPNIVVENMRSVYNKCIENDLKYGKGWYIRANLFSLSLAEEYKISEMKVAGIIAALSPQKEWSHNKALSEEFIRTKGEISRHTGVQSQKALNILNYGDSEEYVMNCLNGKKTINFFQNIYKPTCKKYLTVDRHHIYLSLGWDAQTCTPKQYEFLKENTIKFANELDVIPNELQSTLWVCWKRLKKYEIENKKTS